MQDQSVAIVTEICEANKLKQIHPEIHHICLLLLQIMEMALNLELCVLQICGIRPVLGRVEDFSKSVKLLIQGNNLLVLLSINPCSNIITQSFCWLIVATEGHAFLNTSMKSLKQIISIVYPGLL